MTGIETAAPTTRPTGVGRSGRIAGMEGLRGLAAVSILVYHCGLYAVAGGSVGIGIVDAGLRHLSAGVLFFFTLSGLLLYRPFVEAILGERPFPSLGRYGWNRFFRILPVYWVILVLTGLLLGAAILPGAPGLVTIGFLTDPGLLLGNVLLVQNYRPSTFLTGIGPAWTLAIEVAYYLILPLVAAAAFHVAERLRPSWRVAAALAPPAVFLTIGVVGKVVAESVLDGGSGWDRTWGGVLSRSFFANADLFSFGMVVAVATVLHARGALWLPRGWRTITVMAAIGSIGLALLVPGGALGDFRYDVLAALASALVVAVLVVAPRPGGNLAHRILEHRALVGVGLVSYSLYLWHEPVIHLLVERGSIGRAGVPGLLLAVAVVGAAAGALATLTYLAVERPALRRKARPGAGLRAGHR